MALGEVKRDDEVIFERMGLGSGSNVEGCYKIACRSGAVYLTTEQMVDLIGRIPQTILEKAGYFPPEKTE